MIRKGTYVLFLHFDSDIGTEIGALGFRVLKAGDYCYVGSAMGGLDQRVGRHLSRSKTIRWHIDYLTVLCDGSYAYEHEGDALSECDLAEIVRKTGAEPVIEGFGCSDCRCRTHLFRVDPDIVSKNLADLGMIFFNDKRN